MHPPTPATSSPPPAKDSSPFAQPGPFEPQQSPGFLDLCSQYPCSSVIGIFHTSSSRSSTVSPTFSTSASTSHTSYRVGPLELGPSGDAPSGTMANDPTASNHSRSSSVLGPTSAPLNSTPTITCVPSTSSTRRPHSVDYDPTSFQTYTTETNSSQLVSFKSTASPESGATSTNTGALAGGVVGGVAFLALLTATAFLLIRRHRHRSQPPPSAEFMHLARGPSELAFATLDGRKSPTLHRLIPGPLTRRGSLEDEENIPPLSPTLCYRDPVLEKAQESAAMREKYVASEEGGYQ